MKKSLAIKATMALLLMAGVGMGGMGGLGGMGTAWGAETLQDVLKRRGLSQQDLMAAAKTYTPSGKRDEFIAFSSGGQSGQVIVYGIPSMRIMKYLAVFTPEPWQGYGYDEESKAVLKGGQTDGRIDGRTYDEANSRFSQFYRALITEPFLSYNDRVVKLRIHLLQQ